LKKSISVITAAVLLIEALPLYVLPADSAGGPEISAKAAVLISASTGEIIYEKNCREKLPMASTTKIMTTLLCIESGGLDEKFVVDSEAIKVEGSSMGLQGGDIVTKYALCCGMLLPSGNDAANAAAVRIAGSIPAFADMMNEKARSLGLSHTYFATPSGLEGKEHGSSAYDMALLAREALKNQTFRDICSQERICVEFGNPPYQRWLKNTNKLLSMYDGVYGVKTGFTDEAGRCLVSACRRNNIDLICVTLNDRCDWDDHMALYEHCFSQAKPLELDLPELPQLDIVGGEAEKLPLSYCGGATSVTVKDHGQDDFEYTFISSPFVYAPVNIGDEIAQLSVSCKGREVTRIPLCAAENVPIKQAENRKNKKSGRLKKIISTLRDLLF